MTEGMMGRTSDTRIYNPRSESSTMFRNNDGDGNYNPGDPKYEDEEKQKKQNAREKQEKRERSRKHIKVKPRMLRELDSDEEGQDDSEKIDADREIHAQTGAAGNFGFLSSLAGGAKGPGAARGEMVAMSEAMDDVIGGQPYSSVLRPPRSAGASTKRHRARSCGRRSRAASTSSSRQKGLGRTLRMAKMRAMAVMDFSPPESR